MSYTIDERNPERQLLAAHLVTFPDMWVIAQR